MLYCLSPSRHVVPVVVVIQSSVGEWLSLVEHLVRDQGVGGSNPLSPTNSKGLIGTHSGRNWARLRESEAQPYLCAVIVRKTWRISGRSLLAKRLLVHHRGAVCS